MGFMDKFKEWARVEDEDEEFDEFIPNEESPKKSSLASKKDDRVVNIHTTTQLQVVLVKPDRFEDVTDIADHLCDKKTVVLNLESANREVSRRIIDFLSGVAYANKGNIKKVANSTFIIVPRDVDVAGELMFDDFDSSRYM